MPFLSHIIIIYTSWHNSMWTVCRWWNRSRWNTLCWRRRSFSVSAL